MCNFEHVAGLDSTELFAGFIESSDLGKLADIELVTAKQLVERIATANRERAAPALALISGVVAGLTD
jgi:hypothetical protein